MLHFFKKSGQAGLPKGHKRLNKEFKRRIKPMEIVAGENACYTLLAFVSLKMEIHWRANPIGKVRKNLPFFKQLDASENFTQLN
jgi:putative transposase